MEIETRKHIVNAFSGHIYNKKTNRLCGYLRPSGYKSFILNKKFIYNHRFIYEVFHKIKLTPQQHIKHINNIILDDRIENLELVKTQRFLKK